MCSWRLGPTSKHGMGQTAHHFIMLYFTTGLMPRPPFLKHGAIVNAETDYDETPVHAATCQAGSHVAVEIVDLLLRSGADETIVDQDGRTAAESVLDVDLVDEHVARMHELLLNAAADRAWRRRDYTCCCAVAIPTGRSCHSTRPAVRMPVWYGGLLEVLLSWEGQRRVAATGQQWGWYDGRQG